MSKDAIEVTLDNLPLTEDEAAELVSKFFTLEQFQTKRKHGKGPRYSKLAGSPVYLKEDVLAWLNDQLNANLSTKRREAASKAAKKAKLTPAERKEIGQRLAAGRQAAGQPAKAKPARKAEPAKAPADELI